MDNIVDALNNAYQDFLAAAAGICQFFPRYWSCNALQSSPVVTKLVPAVGIIIFTLWGLEQLMRMSRHFFLHRIV
ncbi:hypothetical protein BVRB_1g022270 [Beta vulgaris subsp. vulgaris]|nr:hypothetical protein BVRB_1g022270 [Beta vulgaris subsp. vulgaris]